MDASEDSQTEDVQIETHIDDTNGSSSPVLSQTPRTRSRQKDPSLVLLIHVVDVVWLEIEVVAGQDLYLLVDGVVVVA